MNTKEIMKLANKVDLTKTAFAVGGLLLLVIMFLFVRKKIKDIQSEKASEKVLDLYKSASEVEACSYSDAEFRTMADSIYAYIHVPVLSINGGILGVNQKGIYSEMSKLRKNVDWDRLVAIYGVREYKKPGYIYLKRPTDFLPGTLKAVLTNGEVKKINEILNDNGLTVSI